jgi:hypothetical protein
MAPRTIAQLGISMPAIDVVRLNHSTTFLLRYMPGPNAVRREVVRMTASRLIYKEWVSSLTAHRVCHRRTLSVPFKKTQAYPSELYK